MNHLVYQVEDKPPFGRLILFALQQLLAIIAGTITVPLVVYGKVAGGEFISASILGCGVGTLVYILVTKRKSPVILSSNFAFIGAMTIVYQSSGQLGVILGGVLAGSVYIVLSLIVRKAGTKWIDKLLPPIIIGPVVALIGLTLAGNAMADLVKGDGYFYEAVGGSVNPYNLVALFIGLITFIIVIICSAQSRFKSLNMVPFLMAILAGYLLASVFSAFGYGFDIPYLKIIDYSPLIENFKEIKVTSFLNYPHFNSLVGIKEIAENQVKLNGLGVVEAILAFVPVAFVGFSEHIADHKNLSSVIGRDLLSDEPGLHRTLLGDGLGSISSTLFGCCPSTTYSQSVGCVAITKNASVWTMILTCFICILISFFTPFIALLQTIPSCVMGGICLALYGFIAASGLKMLKGLEIGEGKNLYTLSSILVSGVGGLVLAIPYSFELAPSGDIFVASKVISVSSIAFALLIGILTYNVAGAIEKKNATNP